jgi:predicted DNA-binding transcriptional regulator YafY
MARTKRLPTEIAPNTPLIRQWQLLEWLVSTSTGVRVAQAAKAFNVDTKTIRRDLVLLKHLGFDLKETVEGPGRKVWRIDKSVKIPKNVRQEYRSIAELLDALMERADELEDRGFRTDLQAFQMRVLRKLKPR